MIVLKPILPAFVAEYKATRLRALQDTPTAFGSTHAKESQFSDADWLQRIAQWNSAHSRALLAWDGEHPCGIVAAFVNRDDSTKASLVSMWVAPTHRRRGIGRLLVSAIIDWAQSLHITALFLTVTSNNDAAIRFYESLGFGKTGKTIPYPNDPALVEFEMVYPMTSEKFQTRITATLAVRDWPEAMDFYKAAFGAVELYSVPGGGVGKLSVNGAEFWVAEESLEHENFSPESLGGCSVRMLLIVEDPVAICASRRCRREAGLSRRRASRLENRPNRRSFRPSLGNRPANRVSWLTLNLRSLMRFMMNVTLPHATFNAFVKDGTAGAKLNKILESIKPEAVYFTDISGQREAVLILDLADASQIPAISEPWFLTFQADVQLRPIMMPADLKKAGLEDLGKKWG